MNPWAGCSQELLDAPPRCDPCPPRRLLSRDQGRNGMSIVRDARRLIARRLIASVVLLALSTGAAPKAPLVNFPTEREAQEHCPNDMVVWLDPPTKTYYYRGQARYGSTKGGAFVCRDEANHAGMRQARSSQ
jgi:hypothetical protein